ncbi:MAG: hypothetical protein ACI965_000356 [Paraglaciecola sp.]|jgi:hypothetical protein
MDMSFKEKSIWVSLVTTLLIFSYYFIRIFIVLDEPEALAKSASLGLLLKMTLTIIVVEVVLQSLLAAGNRKTANLKTDERDSLFTYKANSLGYVVLIIGVMFTIGQMLVLEVNPQLTNHNGMLSIPLLTTHILLFSFILSEVVRFTAQLYFYRSGH